MHADDLYYSLDHYLAPTHAIIEAPDRRCQIEVIEHLADWLWRHRLVDYTNVSDCAVIELDIALATAQRSLAAEEGNQRE